MGGALALLPQRSAFARAPAREQQRPGGALPEPGGEQRGAAHLVGDDPADLAAVEGDIRGADGRLFAVESRAETVRLVIQEVQTHQIGVGEPQHDAVVGVHDLRVHAVPLGEPGTEGQRPRRVHLRAERGVDHHAPVAQLVAEALDKDRPVVGDMTAGAALLVQIRQHIAGGPGIEARGQQP